MPHLYGTDVVGVISLFHLTSFGITVHTKSEDHDIRVKLLYKQTGLQAIHMLDEEGPIQYLIPKNVLVFYIWHHEYFFFVSTCNQAEQISNQCTAFVQ